MEDEATRYSSPKSRLGRWLVEPGRHVPGTIRPILLANLFGTLSIFLGGVFNTCAVAAVATYRNPLPHFVAWLCFEIALGLVRLGVLAHAHHAARRGGRTFTDLYLFLAIAWSIGVGYGSFVGLTSGDDVVAGLTTISAAAMAGGIAFRNFYAPRLCTLMVVLSFGPAAIGAALSGTHALWLLIPQVPVYIMALRTATYGLNGMLVRTIAAEQHNAHRATHDELTGLANRAGLEPAVRAATAGGLHSFFYLDLDGFKAVNDRYGHGAGDTLLRMVAARLAALTAVDGTAARIGGDEFVLLMPESDRAYAVARAERVIEAIAGHPYELGNRLTVTIGTSIGIARIPDHGRDLAAVMSAADGALYEAKACGRCRVAVAPMPEERVTVAMLPRRRSARSR